MTREINVAKTLLAKRKEKGVTQEELAEYIGVSKASVSKWETEQSYPDITLLPALATYFNITIDELIGYSPQMTKEDIRKMYHRLSTSFGSHPFEEALSECRMIVKKYYSCFPLLLQMAILLLNHYMVAPEKKEQEEILEEIIDLCTRITDESGDVWLSRQANSIRASCLLMLQRPQEVLALLDGAMRPYHDDEILLANACLMTGDTVRAKETVQVATYQHVLAAVSFAPLLLYTCSANRERFEETVRRIEAIIDAFRLNKLSPNGVLIFYLSAAQGYATAGDKGRALDLLTRYADICQDFFPYTLHGDDFFDSIEPWLRELDLGTTAPRDERFIRQSMLQGVAENPAFQPLSGEPRFHNILDRLKSNFGGTHNE